MCQIIINIIRFLFLVRNWIVAADFVKFKIKKCTLCVMCAFDHQLYSDTETISLTISTIMTGIQHFLSLSFPPIFLRTKRKMHLSERTRCHRFYSYTLWIVPELMLYLEDHSNVGTNWWCWSALFPQCSRSGAHLFCIPFALLCACMFQLCGMDDFCCICAFPSFIRIR